MKQQHYDTLETVPKQAVSSNAPLHRSLLNIEIGIEGLICITSKYSL